MVLSASVGKAGSTLSCAAVREPICGPRSGRAKRDSQNMDADSQTPHELLWFVYSWLSFWTSRVAKHAHSQRLLFGSEWRSGLTTGKRVPRTCVIVAVVSAGCSRQSGSRQR